KLDDNNLEEVISKAVEVIQNGGLVVYPSDTCYGLATDATNQEAVDKLKQYKQFRGQKPISVNVSSKEMASQYVQINEIADNLYDNYAPGSITIISKGLGKLANGVQSDWGTVGVRIPDHKIPVLLAEKFGKPVTATSANVSYKSLPYSIEQLLKHTPVKSQKLIDLIIDAGELPKNVPSTILDTTMNSMQVLREGKLEFEDAIKKSRLYKKVNTTSADETIQLGFEVAQHFVEIHDNGS